MISFLRGTVVEVLPMRLIIDVGGVGYDVNIPLSTCLLYTSRCV